MAAKLHPFGVQLLHATGTSYSALTDIKALKGPNQTVAASETTFLESTGAIKEYINGWRDSGEISFTMYFHYTQWAVIQAMMRTTEHWRIQFPVVVGGAVGAKVEFDAFPTSFDFDDVSVDSDDCFLCPVTLKITGALTFTAGS